MQSVQIGDKVQFFYNGKSRHWDNREPVAGT